MSIPAPGPMHRLSRWLATEPLGAPRVCRVRTASGALSPVLYDRDDTGRWLLLVLRRMCVSGKDRCDCCAVPVWIERRSLYA